MATYSFLSTDAPLYRKGYATSIAFCCLSGAACVVYAACITWENRRRRETAQGVGLTEDEKAELGVRICRTEPASSSLDGVDPTDDRC